MNETTSIRIRRTTYARLRKIAARREVKSGKHVLVMDVIDEAVELLAKQKPLKVSGSVK